jgi:AAA family ATP:ADP antiporter
MIRKLIPSFLIKMSFHEKIFCFLALACSFLINLEASITKAVSNSLFIHAYGYEYLPYAWLALVPLNLWVVNLYNRFIPRIGLFKMLLCTTGVTGLTVFCAAFFIYSFSWLPFCLYIWKDLYILLMFQQLWSMLAATIRSEQAKYLYGLFWGIGGLGAVTGSCFPGFLATLIGTEKLLLVTIPFYAILLVCYWFALKVRDQDLTRQPIVFDREKPSSFYQGAKLIARSRVLMFIFLIVVFMQLTSTLLDFQFNQVLSLEMVSKDLRTQYLGRFFGIVNLSNVILQFLGSYFALNFVGVKKTHLMIPSYLGLLLTSYLFFPTFPLLALSYGSIKALDYSLFGVVKEMLYIPLKTEEKFQARAVIDVFVYRTAKALASCCIIAIGFLGFGHSLKVITQVLVMIFSAWSLTVLFLLKEEPQKVPAAT